MDTSLFRTHINLIILPNKTNLTRVIQAPTLQGQAARIISELNVKYDCLEQIYRQY